MYFNGLRRLPFLIRACGLVILLLLAVAVFDPALLGGGIEAANQWIYRHFGGFYLWFTLLTTLGFGLLGLSPLGRLKLGRPDDRPEYGFWSWFAMIFCAGMGTGFMFWGGTEPLYHYVHPPYAGQFSPQAMKDMAFGYTFFHWGVSPWAIYGLTAVAMGFFAFNQQRGFRFSAFLTRPLDMHEREQSRRPLQRGIDLVTVLAIVFGLAATMGMGVLNIEGGLEWLLHTEGSPLLELGILVLMCVLFMLSALKGIETGIKFLSNLCMAFSIVLLVALMAAGPGWKVFQSLAGGTWQYLVRFIPMSLGLGHYRSATWVGEWTVKYWSWWIAWAPFVGMFLVLISRGRTIREVVLACILAPTVFSCLWFAVFGQSALDLYEAGRFSLPLADFSHVDRVLYLLLDAYFRTPLVGWVSIVLVALSVINSADSATYTVACLSQDNPEDLPAPGLLVAWGVLFFILTAVLLLCGGIKTLNQITTISVLPFTFLLVAVYGVFLKSLAGEWAPGRLKNKLHLPAIGSEKCPDPSP